jgi:hypothetical protein
MTDGFHDIPDERWARERRLQIRSRIRATNDKHPRCAGCGNDMPVFSPHDFITAEQYDAPGWEWIKYSDLRPGDLVCFWCSAQIVQIEHQFEWGHA